MLEAVRMISSVDTTPYGKAYQTSGFRAIMDCQPYKLPQGTYDEWRFFEPVFTARYAR
jgi:colicin import membrane protein